MSLKKRFEKAARDVQALTQRPSDDVMLQLYALYKQAVEGDAPGRMPVAKGMVGIAKWKARRKLFGMSEADAMAAYCELVDRLIDAAGDDERIQSWRGRVVLVTGASRGIGRAIAVRFAREGAKVILCARSMEAGKLPGTLPETAALIESVGGEAFCAPMDARDADAVRAAVAAGAAHFGGIDAVVCNAGALHIAPFEATELKRFDLVHEVNVRGTFVLCQAALPHLRESDAGRILMLAPPIALDAKWLNGTIAYTLSKYGMSMMTLGLAAELAGDGIAVNAMWPATTIDTAAVRFNEALGGEEMARRSRKPAICGDAALEIMSRPTSHSGEFHTDESALKEAGVDEFEHYAVEPGQPLQKDFYI